MCTRVHDEIRSLDASPLEIRERERRECTSVCFKCPIWTAEVLVSNDRWSDRGKRSRLVPNVVWTMLFMPRMIAIQPWFLSHRQSFGTLEPERLVGFLILIVKLGLRQKSKFSDYLSSLECASPVIMLLFLLLRVLFTYYCLLRFVNICHSTGFDTANFVNTLDLPISTRNSRHYGYMLNFWILTIIIKAFRAFRECHSPIWDYPSGISKDVTLCRSLLITSNVLVDFAGYSQTNFVNASITIKR